MKKEEIINKLEKIKESVHTSPENKYAKLRNDINSYHFGFQEAKRGGIINPLINKFRNRLIIEVGYIFKEFIEKQKYIQSSLVREIEEKNNDIYSLRNELTISKIEYDKLKSEVLSLQNKLNDTKNEKEPNNIFKFPSRLDYKDFEDHFRGSEKEVKERLLKYLEYLRKKDIVVDLGCGRGEFLEILRGKYKATGVELDESMVEICKKKKLSVISSDAIDYLSKLKDKSVDVITGFQIIEHLSLEKGNMLIKLCYDKLKDGGRLILETPNPNSLAIFYNSFYLDPSHIHPIPSLLLKYILIKNGFKNIVVIESNKLKETDSKTERDKEIDKLLFGEQDYAVIGEK